MFRPHRSFSARMLELPVVGLVSQASAHSACMHIYIYHPCYILTVEVLNTETLQWSAAAALPQPLTFAPAAVCGDQIYTRGGV